MLQRWLRSSKNSSQKQRVRHVDELYKILAFDAMTLLSRIRKVNTARFLDNVKKRGSVEEIVAVETILQAISQTTPPTKRPSSKSDAAEQDIYARELRAILSDTSFLPTKRELLLLLGATIGDLPGSLAKKASRDAVVDWAVRRIAESPPNERQLRYRSIRQMFLRKRDSSLQDWADILSKPSQ